MSYTNFTIEVYEDIRKFYGTDPVNEEAEQKICNFLQDIFDEYENEISELNEEVLDLERQIDALQ